MLHPKKKPKTAIYFGNLLKTKQKMKRGKFGTDGHAMNQTGQLMGTERKKYRGVLEQQHLGEKNW